MALVVLNTLRGLPGVSVELTVEEELPMFHCTAVLTVDKSALPPKSCFACDFDSVKVKATARSRKGARAAAASRVMLSATGCTDEDALREKLDVEWDLVRLAQGRKPKSRVKASKHKADGGASGPSKRQRSDSGVGGDEGVGAGAGAPVAPAAPPQSGCVDPAEAAAACATLPSKIAFRTATSVVMNQARTWFSKDGNVHTRLRSSLAWAALFSDAINMRVPGGGDAASGAGAPGGWRPFSAPGARVRVAAPNDMAAVHALIHELAVFEKADDEVDTTPKSLVDDGFGEQPVFMCLVVEVDDAVVAFALSYIAYSTWKGPWLYLEDLYVSEAFRRRQIGTLLIKVLARAALVAGIPSRVGWQVLDWNKPAVRCYESLGAELQSEWLNCRLNSDAVAFLAQS